VTLTKLDRYTYYSYQILGDEEKSKTYSDIIRFRTLPSDGSPVNIGIYGDLGAAGFTLMADGDFSLPKFSKEGKFDLIIHNGDLAYNLGTKHGDIGDKFMKNIEKVSSIVPYMVTPGNHEFIGDSSSYFSNMFWGQTLLGQRSKSLNPQNWFSFDVGPVHVIGISSEVYCEDTVNIEAQYVWLESDLKAVNLRSPRPWVIILGHRPMYSGNSSFFASMLLRYGLQCKDSSKKKCDATAPCKSGINCAYSIEHLLEKYKVDMYNSGHQHLYIRNLPIASSPSYLYEVQDLGRYVNPQYPVYVISGAAGVSNGTKHDRDISEPLELPGVLKSTAFSFSVLKAYNHTHLNYQQIGAEDGSLVDDFWMIRDTKSPPWTKTAKFRMVEDTHNECDQ